MFLMEDFVDDQGEIVNILSVDDVIQTIWSLDLGLGDLLYQCLHFNDWTN